jgi:hypothetical protein
MGEPPLAANPHGIIASDLSLLFVERIQGLLVIGLPGPPLWFDKLTTSGGQFTRSP